MWGNPPYYGQPPTSGVVFVPTPSGGPSVSDLIRAQKEIDDLIKFTKEKEKGEKKEDKKNKLSSADIFWCMLVAMPILGPIEGIIILHLWREFVSLLAK